MSPSSSKSRTTRARRDAGEVLSKKELEAAHCWEADDRVPRRPEMTDFRRRLRYHQSQWRQAHRYPIGSQPIAPKPNGGTVRLVGSRLRLAYARKTGANFLTAGALEAAKARSSTREPHQSVDLQRWWADLLWSTTMSFNLFGDLAADLGLADRAIHSWWPDAPGTVSDVRFEHSPGWLDRAYLGNLMSFDAAFGLDLGDTTQGIIGVVIRYHERTKPAEPKPTRLARYVEVTERSGVFKPGAIGAVNGTDLLVVWLQHLLVLSMLQHPSGRWRWGRFVLVHPAGNTDFADACDRYRGLLKDQATFSSMTVEELLDAGALPARTAKVLRKRYIPR
jgi:PD-(D/E)XK nuclease superfamily protein